PSANRLYLPDSRSRRPERGAALFPDAAGRTRSCERQQPGGGNGSRQRVYADGIRAALVGAVRAGELMTTRAGVHADATFAKYEESGAYHWREIGWGLISHNAFTAERYRQVIDRAAPRAGDRVLDYGCGDGTLLGVLHLRFGRQPHELHGFDPNPLAVQLAGAMLRSHGVQATIHGSTASLPPDYYDRVICTEVIEHTTTPGNLLLDFARVLKPGGRLVVTTPIRLTEVPEDPNHVHEWFPGEFARLFETGIWRVIAHEQDEPARDQPAVSANRRFWLWMAGEAYDGGSLCRVPSAAISRTRPFRQTLLEAVLAHGLDAIASLDGRYQIVLFDAVERVVTVAVDRFGGLPIFWAHSTEGTAFAGGVRGVLMAPGTDARPDPEAIQEAVTFGGFRLGGRTNVRGVKRLRGGAILEIAECVTVRDYWNWPGAPPDHDRPLDELIDEAHRLWQQSI